jgi:hypothetical protein
LFWSAAVASALVIGCPRTIELEESYQEIANRTIFPPGEQAHISHQSCNWSMRSAHTVNGLAVARALCPSKVDANMAVCWNSVRTAEEEDASRRRQLHSKRNTRRRRRRSRGRATSASALPHKLYYVQMHRGRRRCVCRLCICVCALIHTYK